MKEILVILIVAGLSLWALFNPRAGVIGYTWFALMRPDALSWSRGHPYSMTLAICTLIGSLIHLPHFARIFKTSISRGLLLYLVPITLSTALAVDPELSWPTWEYFLRISLMALLIVVFIRNERDLRILLCVIAASLGLIGLKLGLFGFLVGTSSYIDDLEGTMLSDNNMLALALAMAAPLCWYLAGSTTSRLLRYAFYFLFFGSVAGVVMSNSRGGALSVGVALLMIVLRSKRKVFILVAFAVLTLPAVYVMRATYFERLSSITSNEAEADGSIKSRLNHRRAAYAMWKDYPLFGVGFGMNNYVALSPKYLGYDDFHVVHNTYFQILADSGIFAFLLYMILLFGTLFWLQKSARTARTETPGKEFYPLALQTSLCAFAVGSFFLSRDTFDLLYILLTTAAAWYLVQQSPEFKEAFAQAASEQPATDLIETAA